MESYKVSLSLLVLTRNEEKIVEKNLLRICKYLKQLNVLDKFEILVCDYSEDSTPSIIKSVEANHKEIKYVPIKKLGIGAGIKGGIDAAKYDILMFYPIDMSWSLLAIGGSIKALHDGADVVLGSRGVKGSKVARPFDRIMFSIFYNMLVNILFGLYIKDTQGTIAFRKRDVPKYRNHLDDDGAFLQTELLIYSKRNGLKILEMPCKVIDTRKETKIAPIQVATNMLSAAVRKYFKIHFN